MNRSCLTFIHALSPLHAGTGQGVGVIDLPVAREKATNLPFLPGSTLKGTLRDECGDDDLRNKIFGKGGDSTGNSGSAIFTDQRLLCLPVRSLFGTFAWVTSPYILERLKRDSENVGNEITLDVPEVKNENCLVSSNSPLKNDDGKVILEDLDLIAESTDVSGWADWLCKKIFPGNTAWQTFFSERFCIVSDDVMNFLAETATEVTARNKLDDMTKTTVKGALWYEEALPTETILSGILATVQVNAKAEEVFSKVKDLCLKKPLQLGGSMTVGRGLCRVIVDSQGGEDDANP